MAPTTTTITADTTAETKTAFDLDAIAPDHRKEGFPPFDRTSERAAEIAQRYADWNLLDGKGKDKGKLIPDGDPTANYEEFCRTFEEKHGPKVHVRRKYRGIIVVPACHVRPGDYVYSDADRLKA